VTIGGKGRPVIGRIVLDGTPESPVEWTQNEPVEINTANGWFASKIDKDGRFRIDDVPAGKHTVKVSVNAGSRFGGSDRAIGKLELAFTVPDMPGGRSNEPLDLGTIAAKLFDALKVGELAPDFDVERIGTPQKGRRVKLSDYRGKLVLLNFWQAWDGQNDMLVVKEVQQTFGSDPRFVLISLASSRDSAQPDKFVREKGLNWIHGLDGDGVATRYKVREFPFLFLNGRDETRGRVPVTFLIGPDGRILAHDLIGTDLEAVREALDNVKPPAAPNTTSRPRGAP
jgi:peroxiredoxin